MINFGASRRLVLRRQGHRKGIQCPFGCHTWIGSNEGLWEHLANQHNARLDRFPPNRAAGGGGSK